MWIFSYFPRQPNTTTASAGAETDNGSMDFDGRKLLLLMNLSFAIKYGQWRKDGRILRKYIPGDHEEGL